MNNLVKGLLIGLLVAIILIPIVKWFWKRFDKPSKAMIEHKEEQQRQREEQRTWHRIEQQVEIENRAAETKALEDRRRAELRERARPPTEDVKSEAFAALGTSEPLKPIIRDDVIEHDQIRQDIVIEAPEEQGPQGPPDPELMMAMQSDLNLEPSEEIPELEPKPEPETESEPEPEPEPEVELPPAPELPEIQESFTGEDDWSDVNWH